MTTSRVCAWCSKTFIDGKWELVNNICKPYEVITHGMCQDCARNFIKEAKHEIHPNSSSSL